MRIASAATLVHQIKEAAIEENIAGMRVDLARPVGDKPCAAHRFFDNRKRLRPGCVTKPEQDQKHDRTGFVSQALKFRSVDDPMCLAASLEQMPSLTISPDRLSRSSEFLGRERWVAQSVVNFEQRLDELLARLKDFVNHLDPT
jgi:hypothetical protein